MSSTETRDPSTSQMLSDTAEFDSEVYFTPKENEWDLRSPSPSPNSQESTETPVNEDENVKRLDILTLLPDELAIKCLHGLGPKILSKISKVSRRYHLLASDDSLWKPACMRRWANKKHIEFRLNPRVDYSSLLDRLSVKEMKEILKARKVNLTGVTEKSEMKQLVRSTVPREAPKQQGILWTAKWKASFVVAELDSVRTEITKEELCSFEWAFRLRFADWPDDKDARAKFNRDYSYDSDLFYGGDRKMTWRFYLKDVQVEQYPPLTVTRSKDWGYVLDNGYAFFRSLNEGTPRDKKNEFHAAT